MDKKLLIISHVADNDGITPIILAKLAFPKFDKLLLEISEVNQNVRDNLDKYDEIHVVDLNISEELAEEINKNENYKNKIKIFDHHISGINLNKYPFITVIDEKNGRKESGTSIYYNYLKQISDNKILHSKATESLTEYVRLIDTFDFKNEEEKENANNIGYLFDILGKDNYIDYFYNYLQTHETFEYQDQEKLLIKLQKDKVDNYIKRKEAEMFKAKLDNYNVGVIYAESNRSLLGNYLINKHEDLDFIILINVSRSISYRGKDKADLSIISQKYGGGGHKNAAGSPLPKDLLNNITKLIYNNIEIKGEEKWNQNFI